MENNEGQMRQFRCTHCGNHFFDVRYMLAVVDSFHPENTSGNDQLAPMPVYVCINCKNLVKDEDMRKGSDAVNESAKSWAEEHGDIGAVKTGPSNENITMTKKEQPVKKPMAVKKSKAVEEEILD